MAEEHGLLVTGGSDCHGVSKGKPLIGTVKLPYEYVRELKAAVARRESGVRQELGPDWPPETTNRCQNPSEKSSMLIGSLANPLRLQFGRLSLALDSQTSTPD